MFNKNPPALPFPPIFISAYFIMPYSINKLARGSYEVVNSKTGKIHAKHTSLTKAKAQVRLLGMKDGMKGGVELTPEIVRHLDTLRRHHNPNPEQYHRILQRLSRGEPPSALKRIFQEEVPPLFQSKGRLNPLHQPRGLSDATTGRSESPYSSDGHSSGESDDAPTVSSLTYSSGRGRMRGGLTPTPQLQQEIDRLYYQYLPTQPELARIMEHIHALPDSAVEGDLPEMVETAFRVGMDMEGRVPNITETPFTNGKGRMTGGLDLTDHDVDMNYQRFFLEYSPNPAQEAIIREAIEALPPEALAEGGSDLPEMIEACFKVGMDIDDGDPPAGKPSGKGYSGGATYGEPVMDLGGNFVAVPPNYMHGSLPFF
jgi:hypothetical protein